MKGLQMLNIIMYTDDDQKQLKILTVIKASTHTEQFAQVAKGGIAEVGSRHLASQQNTLCHRS